MQNQPLTDHQGAHNATVRVTTSCLAYRNMCEHAEFFAQAGCLDRFIHTYPPSYVRKRFHVEERFAKSLLGTGILTRVLLRAWPHLSRTRRDQLMERIHVRFGQAVARNIAPTSTIVAGMSSYMVEPIRAARERGMVSVVHHGSLHQRVERRLIEEEAEICGLPPVSEISDWVIAREDEEFRTADRIAVQSRASWRSMAAEGVDERKLWINPLGVNVDYFNPPPDDVKRETSKIFRVVQVGSFIPRKGLHYLAQAFYELNLPDAELCFVGHGYEHSAIRPLLERYRRDNIKIVGVVSREDLPRQYGQSSVFVLPSIADGFAAVVTEAMACGLPVIVTENVGSGDLVREGETGHVVPIRDVEALKEKLLALYQDRERCIAMGRQARQTVIAGNSWKDHSARELDWYTELLAGR